MFTRIVVGDNERVLLIQNDRLRLSSRPLSFTTPDNNLGCRNRVNNRCGICASFPADVALDRGALLSGADLRTTSRFPESDQIERTPACVEGSSLYRRVQLTD
jgi:hypothetical protein